MAQASDGHRKRHGKRTCGKDLEEESGERVGDSWLVQGDLKNHYETTRSACGVSAGLLSRVEGLAPAEEASSSAMDADDAQAADVVDVDVAVAEGPDPADADDDDDDDDDEFGDGGEEDDDF